MAHSERLAEFFETIPADVLKTNLTKFAVKATMERINFVAISPTAACSLLLVNYCCGHWTAVVFIELLCGHWTDCLFWTTQTKHIKQENNANGSS